jgi:hypothetical protein
MQDISRHILQPEKQYSGARMQKGRVILDSDFNEGEMLDDEGQRVVVVDVVGRHGSSDRGFQIGIVVTGSYDFDILAGSYYLGGLRHEIGDFSDPSAPQSFRAQTNWRQSNRVGEVPAPPTVPVAARHDLAYLVGWEQSVTAIEDGELIEHSLGGLDTSTRARRMNRVYVADDGPDNCAEAFDALVTGLIAGGHSFDTTSSELKSAARLTVLFDVDPEPEDLCVGAVANGYRGTENQAIRVQLIAPDRFLWALDNASPLFRIAATVDEGVVTVVFLTPPLQQAHFPLAGQVLEILPWGAELPSGEHVADHEIAADIGGGVFARVTTTYNPRTKTLQASIVDQLTLERMLAWFATELVPEGRRFFYLRVWNPDEEHPVDEYGTPCVLAAAPLGGTGLSVQLNQVGIVGDHWVIAARPTTPDVVVPWELGEGAAPHGPRRFYCPLAIIHWTLEEDELQVEAESCRRTFRALTRLGGCCSVTVGDGETSHGDYPTVGEALLALPLTGPGKICVLPGVYQEIVHISGRSGLVIEGCGPRTIFRTPPGNMRSHAIVTVDGCEDVILRDFAVEATGQFGVGVLAASDGTQIPSRRITLENLVITTERDATLDPPSTSQLAITETATAFPVCTIAAIGVEQLKLVECTLTMIGDLSAAANVLLAACTRVVVRECRILTPPGEGVASKAWGGLHIAGNCSDVLVERCEIHEGLGFGITLGSVRALANTDSAPSNEKVIDEGEDCPAVGGGFPYAATDVVKHAPEPGPHGVQLRRNRISGMGSSGISVLGFFPEAAGEAIPQIETHELVIADNLIENNYIHPSEKAPSSALRPVVAFGGIILAHADGLRIHDNRIHANGVDHRHPVCGIYVLHGENIVVENNQIRGNGLAGSGLSGNRAGIALQLVGRRVTVEEDDAGEQLQVSPNSALPAARVRGNVVLQPAGRALQVYGIGPTEDDPSEGDHVGHRVRHRLGGRVLIIVLNDVVGHDEVRGLHHPGVIIWIDRRVRPEANHGDPRAAHAANPIADDPELGRRRAAVDLDFLVTARQEGRQREISPHAGAILVVGDHETSGGVEVAGIAKDRHFAVTDGPERDAVAQSADDLVTLQGDIRAPDQLDAAPGPAPHLCGGRRCKNFAVPDEAVRDLVEDDIRRAAQGPGHGELAAGDREPLREVHGDCAQRERR